MKKLILISCLAISSVQAMQKQVSITAAQAPMQVRRLNNKIQELLLAIENRKSTLGTIWDTRCMLIDEYEKLTDLLTQSVKTKATTQLRNQIEDRFNKLNTQFLELLKQGVAQYKNDCITFNGIKNCRNFYEYLRRRINLRPEVPEVLSSAIQIEIESLLTTAQVSPPQVLSSLYTELNNLLDSQGLSFEEFYNLYGPLMTDYIFFCDEPDQSNQQVIYDHGCGYQTFNAKIR